MTSQATRNATSSPGAVSGPSQLDLLDGLTTARCGQAPAPASRSRRPEKGSEPMIQGICGRTFIASSESADQPLFLESKSPTPPGPDGPLMLTCTKCGVEKPSSDFYKNRGKHASSSGYHAQCKTCCKERQAAYRTGTKRRRSDSHRKYRDENRARVLVNAARTRAKQAGIPFDLDEHVDAIQTRIDRGFCELTGLPLRVEGGRTWDSPSLDRIVPELGYEITNVRVVLFAVNVMMNTWGEEPILTVADAIRTQREQDEAHPLFKWEQRLKERLASIGSTESSLIWTRSVTPQGLPISRLAVSTRHTNEIGSTGSQWSTPRASDGEKGGPNMSFGAGGQPLPAQMHQASPWVTPSARDWKDSAGMATEAGDRNRVDQLPRQMAQNAVHWMTPTVEDASRQGSAAAWMKYREEQHFPSARLRNEVQMVAAYMPTPTVADEQGGRKTRSGSRSNEPLLNGLCFEMEPTGPTPNGSSATTTKRGAPNPVFAFWLMGFPDEWISGALAAMQSFPRRQRRS